MGERSHPCLPGVAELVLLGAEGLALLALVALLAEALAGDAAALGADADQVAETVLDVPLAVVGLVRDAGDEVVDAGGGIEVRGADLTELVKQPVTELPPVLTQLLLNLLTLLLLLLSHS